MVHDVTVADEDVDVLKCGICYRPLKPPIFQVHTTGPANLDIRAFVPASSIRFPVLYLLITVKSRHVFAVRQGACGVLAVLRQAQG